MDTINANTKIAAILRQHPDALEAIISISPKFNKLRNPLLRKIMASRTSVGMASKIGGCSIDDFFEKLKVLGFLIDKSVAVEKNQQPGILPDFMKTLSSERIVELDVRPALEEGNDPFNLIHKRINQLKPQQVLKLINSFEPIPLIKLLSRQGFETYSESVNDDLVFTYFFKSTKAEGLPELKAENGDWDAIQEKFRDKLIRIDVRHLEMPLPMLTILDELEKLATGHALFVYHKRIPVFLLPELQERKFEYRINEISDGEVHLLIFKT